jgi:hypothetical protein
MSAADSGLVSPDFASFQSIFSSVDFIRAQFIFKPSGRRQARAPRVPTSHPNRLTNHRRRAFD